MTRISDTVKHVRYSACYGSDVSGSQFCFIQSLFDERLGDPNHHPHRLNLRRKLSAKVSQQIFSLAQSNIITTIKKIPSLIISNIPHRLKKKNSDTKVEENNWLLPRPFFEIPPVWFSDREKVLIPACSFTIRSINQYIASPRITRDIGICCGNSG